MRLPARGREEGTRVVDEKSGAHLVIRKSRRDGGLQRLPRRVVRRQRKGGRRHRRRDRPVAANATSRAAQPDCYARRRCSETFWQIPANKASGKPALTPRERDIVEILIAAASNKTIAARLGIAEQSVKNRLSVIYRKFVVSSRLELAVRCMNWDGWYFRHDWDFACGRYTRERV